LVVESFVVVDVDVVEVVDEAVVVDVVVVVVVVGGESHWGWFLFKNGQFGTVIKDANAIPVELIIIVTLNDWTKYPTTNPMNCYLC